MIAVVCPSKVRSRRPRLRIGPREQARGHPHHQTPNTRLDLRTRMRRGGRSSGIGSRRRAHAREKTAAAAAFVTIAASSSGRRRPRASSSAVRRRRRRRRRRLVTMAARSLWRRRSWRRQRRTRERRVMRRRRVRRRRRASNELRPFRRLQWIAVDRLASIGSVSWSRQHGRRVSQEAYRSQRAKAGPRCIRAVRSRRNPHPPRARSARRQYAGCAGCGRSASCTAPLSTVAPHRRGGDAERRDGEAAALCAVGVLVNGEDDLARASGRARGRLAQAHRRRGGGSSGGGGRRLN